MNSEFAEIQNDASQKMRDYIEKKKSPLDFQYNHGNYFTELLKKIDNERDQEIKDYLKLNYVSFAGYKPQEYSYEKAGSFFQSIPPENYAWELVPHAFNSYYTFTPQYKWDNLQDEFLKNSRSTQIKILILSNKLMKAKLSNDVEETKKLHTLILNDYKDLKEAQSLLKAYPINPKINIGKEIPDFNVVSIDDSTKIYSKKSMMGKIYLIDFWATWCGPCVGEMENLHKAYEEFKTKGFEILSFSLDSSPEIVKSFREKKWKMPWKNSFIGNKEREKIADDFEVMGIPKPILVSAEGKIIALENELRGEQLEQTLSKYLK